MNRRGVFFSALLNNKTNVMWTGWMGHVQMYKLGEAYHYFNQYLWLALAFFFSMSTSLAGAVECISGRVAGSDWVVVGHIFQFLLNCKIRFFWASNMFENIHWPEQLVVIIAGKFSSWLNSCCKISMHDASCELYRSFLYKWTPYFILYYNERTEHIKWHRNPKILVKCTMGGARG